MESNIDFLSKDELKEIRKWAMGRRDHFTNIIKKIDNCLGITDLFDQPAQDEISSQVTVGVTPSVYEGMSVKELIITVMKEIGLPLSNSDIRNQIRRRVGREVSGNGVRAQLKSSEGTSFVRIGKGKYTKWKLVEEK